jgi:hypothetical protein
MKVSELISVWDKTAAGELTEERFNVRLRIEDAARIAALAEMFPRRSIEELITDVLAAGLSEIEASLPYVRGATVVATDEQGDPVYEDIGPTPRYLELWQKHFAALQQA